MLFDKLLEMMKDGEWHTTDGICQTTNYPKTQVLKVLDFLNQYKLIHCIFGEEKGEITQCRMTAKFKKLFEDE